MNKNTKYSNSIIRFKEIHLLEAKTILLFLLQIGDKKEEMLNNFVKMQVLHEKICNIKENMLLLKNMKIYRKKELKCNIKIMRKDKKNYNKYKKKLERYIKKFGSKSEIFICFKTMILYELIIQNMIADMPLFV